MNHKIYKSQLIIDNKDEMVNQIHESHIIHQSFFPGNVSFRENAFDCITMLAVLEHIIDKAQIVRECFRVLSPGGRVVLTVPHPRVDTILDILRGLKIIGGMSTEEHHEFYIDETPKIFERQGFRLLKAQPFQFGLNRLYVFQKP